MTCFILLDLGEESGKLSLGDDKRWRKLVAQVEENDRTQRDKQLVLSLKNAGYEVAFSGEGGEKFGDSRVIASIVENNIDPLYWLADKKKKRRPFFLALSVANILSTSEQTITEWFEDFERFYFKSGLARKSILIVKESIRNAQPVSTEIMKENQKIIGCYLLLHEVLNKKYTLSGEASSERELLQNILGFSASTHGKQESL